jgi:hypothetical protein
MELKTYRVYLNGVLLINTPNGLDTFLQEFIRDNDLFGIYSVSSFDLQFIGDGFCILRDFQEDFDSCQMTIKIDRYCNSSWSTLYNGIIEVGSVEIDEEFSVATCEIQDNSPLSLISRNSEVDIDIETEQDIFGGDMPVAPIYDNLTLYSPNGVLSYADVKYIKWDDLIKTVLRGITGVPINVTSTFFNTIPTDSQWTITYTGNMASIDNTTITYRNFQGIEVLRVANLYTGNNHLTNVRAELLSGDTLMGVPPYTDAEVTYIGQYVLDYRDFTFTSQNNATKTITLNCSLPIEILDVQIVSADPSATVSFAQVSDYIDGGNSPLFMNYKMIAVQDAPYQFRLSFKNLMQELNKNYNVYFLASYNTQGGIDLRIEDYQYFANVSPNITFDNVRNLKIAFDSDSTNNAISTGEPSDTTMATKNYTFGSDFCGLGDNFDAKSSFVIGTNRIWNDVQLAYDADYEQNIYMIENLGEREIVQVVEDRAFNIADIYNMYLYNQYLSNYHKIYRHLNKFKNNIVGTVPVWRQSSNINITNIAQNRLFKRYEFSTFISEATFNSLIDNVVDKVRFKKENDTSYRTGLITALKYNNLTGKAEITTLGE